MHADLEKSIIAVKKSYTIDEKFTRGVQGPIYKTLLCTPPRDRVKALQGNCDPAHNNLDAVNPKHENLKIICMILIRVTIRDDKSVRTKHEFVSIGTSP